MAIIDRASSAVLLANGRRQAPLRGSERELDLSPVVVFTPDTDATWLLTELAPEP